MLRRLLFIIEKGTINQRLRHHPERFSKLNVISKKELYTNEADQF
jgi:hypothetical protein